MNTVKAFYFTNEHRKLRYGDNRKIVIGKTHSVDIKPVCCRQGLHASRRVMDALEYAPGPILYLVELSGDIDERRDKLAANRRTYLAEYDANDLLREFARKQAQINTEKIKPYCSKDEYQLITDYLSSGDQSMRLSAKSAAHSAARSAEESVAAFTAIRSMEGAVVCLAAESAARSAERSAGNSVAEAARAATRLAADSAAYSTTEPEAYSVSRSEADHMLLTMLKEKTGWDI